MTQKPLRVVKLGGSLLGYERLREHFQAWLDRQAPVCNVLILGGGELVEAIRRLDALYRFDPESAHWAAIEALGVTARLGGSLFPNFVLTHDLDNVRSGDGDDWILDVSRSMRDRAGMPGQLPCSWDVTSDSIAAWFANAVRATELVLAKSRLPLEASDLASLASEGYVDAFFPQAAANLGHLRIVNLRDPLLPECYVDLAEATPGAIAGLPRLAQQC